MRANAARTLLATRFLTEHKSASASILEKHSPEQVCEAILSQDSLLSARALEQMLPQRVGPVLEALDEVSIRNIVSAIDPQRTAAALHWLDADSADRILASLPSAYAKQVREQMSYPSDTAGALMDPQFVGVRESNSVADALARLRGFDKPLYQVFVVDDEQHLVGAIPIQNLATADPTDAISTLVLPIEGSLDAFSARDEVADFLSETALPSIAVVDRQHRLLGVLRHRTLLGVAEHEVAAAMQRMVGANEDESALSPVNFAVRKRLPWLNINLLTAFLAASVVGLFESTIAQVTSLAVLLPVVAGQSGNSGSQALVVTMRSLALREISTRDWVRVAIKETMVGIVNGLSIAVVTCIGVYIWSRSWALSAVISISMIVAMAAAGLSGASIPVLLKSIGQDPAQSSSIILTTVTDIVGFFTFLGLATMMMSYLL